MDKSTRIIIGMLLEGHRRSEIMTKKCIKLFTNKKIEPVPLEAFKKYLLEFYK